MLTAQQAEDLILNLVHPFADFHTETVGLLDASGRVLAAPVSSQLDFPHWDNSAMDGYAVRHEDVQAASAEHPITLTIGEEIPAGYQPQNTVTTGQAARIFTGAIVPPGADTIVMQEDTQRDGTQVAILVAPKPQAFVRRKGAYYKAGEPLLSTGCKLGAAEIAVLAAAQCPRINVFRRPRVAIFSTGDELVSLDRPLQPGQIVDSNRYALLTLVTQAGCEPIDLGVIPDQPAALSRTIAQAITAADVVLSSGGVSVGDYDYIDQILADLGATIHIRSVAIKPGKPLTVATFPPLTPFAKRGAALPQPLYFGLPGNPVSALVTFWRFVLPAIRKLSGVAQPWQAPFVTATTRQALKSDGKRESYVWGKLTLVNGQYEFELASGSHISGNLINLAGTNGLAVVPLGETAIAQAETVQVLPMDY
ncbi:MAG: molybdopterin molybdotransferase MoeA [Leptolyngbyaceae cyanobacterium bins.302]|nr:molybdopterin molybdotransferase MoeA [Leptolyngbyaceae cyanobacterium bins.302]